ncbi:unnamed protein product [Caenorhabditis angaria]|uniref:Uncharacterized protein n=1 Tax=Caenorhabditis angaria TaxID=860376 RepID=A0A9P1IDE6_9PELO|nr:unnamed protein product [Caenorhabditis angaria]
MIFPIFLALLLVPISLAQLPSGISDLQTRNLEQADIITIVSRAVNSYISNRGNLKYAVGQIQSSLEGISPDYKWNVVIGQFSIASRASKECFFIYDGQKFMIYY